MPDTTFTVRIKKAVTKCEQTINEFLWTNFVAEPDEFNASVEKACDSVDQSRGDFYESKVTVFRRGEKIDEMQQSLETEVLEESKY